MEKLKLKKQIHKQFTFPSKSNEKGWHTFCFPNLPFDDVEEDTNTENKESIEQSNGDEDSSDEESEVYEATTNEVTESTYPQLTPLIFMDHVFWIIEQNITPWLDARGKVVHLPGRVAVY